MSIVASDLKHRKSLNHPSNNDDTVGGGISTSPVGSTIGDIFHAIIANAYETDPTKKQYKKTFLLNDNSDTPLTSGVIWLINALNDVSSNGAVAAVSTSASDDNTKKIKVVGEDASGTIQTEEITLNGTTEVNGSSIFSKIFWVWVLGVSSGDITNAVGDITVKCDSVALGIIPSSCFCCLSIVKIGLAATLDDTVTTTNAVTAPSGISFSKPRTEASGISMANSGSLTNGSAQGIWWELTVEGGLVPASQLRVEFGWSGNTA